MMSTCLLARSLTTLLKGCRSCRRSFKNTPIFAGKTLGQGYLEVLNHKEKPPDGWYEYSETA